MSSRPVRFLLVNPAAPQWRVSPGRSPPRITRVFRFSMLSSLAVAAAMPEGVETRILDEEVEPLDPDEPADLVGVSLMTFNAPRAYEIADAFRRKGRPVVLGGYHPTFRPEEALSHADAVCVGEAEPNVGRLLDDLRAGRLRPVYDEGPADLSTLRRPDRSLVPRGRYAWVDPIQATRGCPHGCTFCSISSFFDRRFRTRPVEDVVDELRELGPRILFLDDNLTVDPDYARELFARMIPLGKLWYSQSSVTLADDPELLGLAVRSGCRGVFVGFESLSEEGLSAFRKDFARARDYRRAVERFQAAGVGVQAGIVLGHDADGPEVFRETLAFLLTARLDALQATILTPFPGTPLFDELERAGRIVDRDWSRYDFRHAVFEPKHMSRQTLQAGHDWLLARFYSIRAVAGRLLGELSYLGPGTILRATAPLNFGYRVRLQQDRTWRRKDLIARGDAHP
jgi:radical SAM superfamily enzyme YgiQ (UPF0313 family)